MSTVKKGILSLLVVVGFFSMSAQAQPETSTETERAKPTETERAEPSKTETVEPTKTERADPTKTERAEPTEPKRAEPTESELADRTHATLPRRPTRPSGVHLRVLWRWPPAVARTAFQAIFQVTTKSALRATRPRHIRKTSVIIGSLRKRA